MCFVILTMLAEAINMKMAALFVDRCDSIELQREWLEVFVKALIVVLLNESFALLTKEIVNLMKTDSDIAFVLMNAAGYWTLSNVLMHGGRYVYYWQRSSSNWCLSMNLTYEVEYCWKLFAVWCVIWLNLLEDAEATEIPDFETA